MGTAIDPKEIKRFELTEVYSHPDAKVDIVLVHGLNGDPQRSWTSPHGVFWPTQLLPVTLKSAKARILVYGYNADVYAFGKGSASSDMIHQHAQTLLANLSLERKSEEASDHPIIWVAHSLGGILVKRALNLSDDLKDKYADDLRSIAVSTYGIIFLGTPHTGADPAKWGLMLQGMVNALMPKKVVHTEDQLVKTLQTSNETLQNINLKFLEIYQKFRVYMVHEGVPTDLKGTKMFIVDQISASPQLPGVVYYGIEATHSGMCKFESKNSPGYSNISGTIKSWVEESPRVIESRRESEKQKRWRDKNDQAAELLGYYPTTPQASNTHTPDPANSVNNSTIMVKSTVSIEPDDSEPNQFLIKPSGFRPNSLFVGREKELSDMHKMLFDKKRRSEGTSAILIQCLPGGGKSHLARQYVYDHKDDYPGGIFWLRAKSVTELAAGFWDIARKAVLKDSGKKEDIISPDDPQQFIKIVKKWLNRRHDWLMVLDGIHFGDTEALRKFIPDSTNTSLIYTSTEKSVSGSHHFMNPQIIRLPLLSAREAQQLLLLELDKREPFSKDDLKHSMELVQAMGLLPVVIHAVAQRLKSTDEPLSKFARHYASEPRLSGLGAYKAVVDQLEKLDAREALNLVHILCFFSQHIPVEMISLGLKALDVPVKASEPLTGRSLNNTFRHLNMFALIDRNEPERSIHSSQSSKSSRDMLADNVDVIRLHGVVQGFFIDTLNADESLPLWLDRAVRVFCLSYENANVRITRKTHAGLVEDYRLYEIHGYRLQQHLARYQKRYPMLIETHKSLNDCLQAIEFEIDRRTPESSQTIAGGRPDAFQTSIFDRTSSSSDTGPETPKLYDKYPPGMSPWGFDVSQAQLESPSSLTHDAEYMAMKQDADTYGQARRGLLHVPQPEDDGYDSDREGSTAMTLQPSSNTIHPATPLSPDGAWVVVQPRRSKKSERRDLHRTVKRMEKDRYRDRAGSFRSLNAIDPRVSHEHAHGYLQKTLSRDRSRSRMSGQSSAEVALAHITHNSPPPPREGGVIRDQPLTVRRPYMLTGTASYASAVASPTSTIGLPSTIRHPTEPPASSTESVCGSAIASLQKFPIEVVQHAPSSRQSYTPMPPYPPSPGLSYQHSEHLSGGALSELAGHSSSEHGDYFPRNKQESAHIVNDPYPSKVYPRMTGPVPVESNTALSTSPLKRDLPHDYPVWHSQGYSEGPPFMGKMPDQYHDSQFATMPSPNPRPTTYHPGRPEFSFSTAPNQHDGGYTSQPMSRDPSGQTAQSDHSNHSRGRSSERGRGRRRPSVAETEPLPQLPVFSPRSQPTSYEIYEQMTAHNLIDGGGRFEQERAPGYPVRKSPRLRYAGAAASEGMGGWNGGNNENLPPQRRNFNPTVPAFTPSLALAPPKPPTSTRAHSVLGSRQHAEYPFAGPQPGAVHSHSAPQSNMASAYPSQPSSAIHSSQPSPTAHQGYPPNTSTQHYSTNPPHFPPSQPHSFGLPRSFTNLEEFDPIPPLHGYEAPEMGRTGSGGVMVGGGRVIEFGDFPEKVDTRQARLRVDQSWNEREMSEHGKGAEVGLGIKGVRR